MCMHGQEVSLAHMSPVYSTPTVVSWMSTLYNTGIFLSIPPPYLTLWCVPVLLWTGLA